MMWNIEEAGEAVAGWLIADNPGAVPTLTLVLDGGRERRLHRAENFRPDIQRFGLHASGQCGFRLEEDTCPGLNGGEVEIYDAASNTLLFRRAPGADLEIRLFHLETQTFPVYGHGRQLLPLVQMVYSGAEMISEETLTSVLRITWPSAFVSGAILYKNYENGLHTQGYRRTILLSEPARELASRLLRVKSLGADPETRAGWRRLGLGRLVEAFAEVDIRDPASLGRAFKRLGDEDFTALASPTVRKLVAKTQDVPLERHHVGVALDSLAGFDAVGFDDDLDGYVDGLEALLGRDGLSREKLEAPPELPAVAAAIDACRPAGEFLEYDLELTALVRVALDKAVRG